MRATVSFHPIDPGFMETMVDPLISGRKVNPEPFQIEAIDARRHAARARRAPLALETIIEEARYKDAPPEAGLWTRVRTKLERFDHRPGDLAKRVTSLIDPELHLYGRPYFVTEGSAEHVAETIDEYRWAPRPEAIDVLARAQLDKLDKGLGSSVRLADEPDLSPELTFRAELLAEFRAIHDLARAAREGGTWSTQGGETVSASEALPQELPWRAVALHARVVPYWTARDMVGLETVCRAAGLPSPDVLLPALRLFSEACELFPALKESLHGEPGRPRDVGGYVAPSDIAQFLEFLATQGSRIIGAAAREGEGTACALLLRKMRECATYAQRHKLGYLEATGIPFAWPE